MHRIRFCCALTTAALFVVCAVPASSVAAILVGMESNRELVNSTQTPALQAQVLDVMKEQGVQVVRANYRWYDAAEACGDQTPNQLENHENPCYNWSRLDGIVQQANARGMQVLLSISQNPTWLHGSTDRLYMGASATEFARTVEHYAAFYRAAGSRYAIGSAHGEVFYWTIHNEPNSNVYWSPKPDPKRYAELYGRAAVALRASSPDARIAPGPTGPTGGKGMKPIPFIKGFLKHVPAYLPGRGAAERRYINAWAHNPYPGTTTQPSFSKPSLHKQAITMGTIHRLFKTLDQSPLTRGTKVWATEFGWETNGPASTTFANQTQFIPEAFDWLDATKRVQIGISYGMTDPPSEDVYDWTSGTIGNDGVRKPSFAMFQRMVSVPQGGTSGRVRRGAKVSVWGRSNVDPAGGKLMSKVGSGPWKPIVGQRRDGNKGIRATVVVRATTKFATWDPTGGGTYGPSRTITVR